MLAHLEMFSLEYSSSWIVIRVNLLHPKPSLFLYGILLSSMVEVYCYQVSFNLRRL